MFPHTYFGTGYFGNYYFGGWLFWIPEWPWNDAWTPEASTPGDWTNIIPPSGGWS